MVLISNKSLHDKADVGRTFSPAALVGQFILSKSRESIPAGWHERRHNSWYLGFHPALPVTDIQTSNGSFAGWLLGWPISPDGRLVSEQEQFPIVADGPNAPEEFETALYEYGGRFAAVCLMKGASRFYLDPCGSLAAVFCPAQELVASTPTLVPHSEDTKDNGDLIRALGMPEKNAWYPFGLTPRHGVERLLPNHFLDLDSWRTQRHWPTESLGGDGHLGEATVEIAAIIERHISAVARQHPLYLPLTAGRDSRILLACAREHLGKVVFFTLAKPAPRRRTDLEVGRSIAAKLGLNHIVLPFRYASESELEQWGWTTGDCVGGWDRHFVLGLRDLKRHRVYLSGQAGDLARAPCWRPEDTASTSLLGQDLVGRLTYFLRMPRLGEIEQRAQRWLESVPFTNALTVLDLLYIEQRLGGWAGPKDYGHVSSAWIMYPFSHRRVFTRMMMIAPELKRNKMLEAKLVERQWPELLRFPFNVPLGVRGLLCTVSDSVRRRWRRVVVRYRSI